jgi:hypothetical protein
MEVIINMKEINVNGRTFQYEVEAYAGEFGYYHETEFYEGYETYSRKRYFLFGDIVTISKPKWVFTIYCDIESEHYTKSEIRTKIEKQVELLERKKQIERGEII